VTSSSGGSLAIAHGTAAGTINLPATSGWQNLTYMDIIHDQNEANAIIRLDHFNMTSPTAVPEPSSIALVATGVIALIGSLKHRRQCAAC
jgi:PEP-CTERM motif